MQDSSHGARAHRPRCLPRWRGTNLNGVFEMSLRGSRKLMPLLCFARRRIPRLWITHTTSACLHITFAHNDFHSVSRLHSNCKLVSKSVAPTSVLYEYDWKPYRIACSIERCRTIDISRTVRTSTYFQALLDLRLLSFVKPAVKQREVIKLLKLSLLKHRLEQFERHRTVRRSGAQRWRID